MVNPIGDWLRIPFRSIFRIPLGGLSGFWGIGFRIPLRGLSSFRVTLGLVVPEHPLTVPVCCYFELSMSFVAGFKYTGRIVLWCHIGWCLVT